MNEYLRNFILQNTIEEAHYNVETREWTMDKTIMTDELLGTLFYECAKYGLNEMEARSLITQTTGSVNVSPSIVKVAQNVEVSNIPVGRHLKIMFNVEEKGTLGLEMLCVERNKFVVLNTDIPGIAPFDIVSPAQYKWNIGCVLQFEVERNGEKYPGEGLLLQIGTYQYMDEYLPSYIHKLYDTGKTFSYDEYVIKENTSGIKYVNTVEEKDGKLVFHAKENDEMPKKSLFRIIPNKDCDTATLELNVDYINELISQGQTKTMQQLRKCCISKKNGKSPSSPVRIECTEPGTLQCSDISSSDAYWTITAKPVIKIY